MSATDRPEYQVRFMHGLRLTPYEWVGYSMLETIMEMGQFDDAEQVLLINHDAAPEDVSEIVALAWWEHLSETFNPAMDSVPQFIERHVSDIDQRVEDLRRNIVADRRHYSPRFAAE